MLDIRLTRSRRARQARASIAHQEPAEYPATAGVYDVEGVIVASPWGPPGTRETGVFTIQHSRDAPLFTGSFDDFRFNDSGSAGPVGGYPLSGSISGSFDCVGRVIFDLHMEQLSSPLWHAEGTLEPAQLTGHFWDPGSNVGTFTAVPSPRR